ncbi:MAG: hypothetical protein ACREMQ_20295, partial [Longimicrobiales bacterium]
MMALVIAATLCSPAAAQDPVVVRDTVAQDTLRGPSPRGAFLRSLLIPGWGQASVGSYTRGGIFFAIQSTSGYM